MTTRLLGVDVETTGLNERNPHGRILELGFVILTPDLDVVDRASWVMPLPETTRERAEEFARTMHDKSGLWAACAAAWDENRDRDDNYLHPLLQAVEWVEQRDMMRAPMFGSSVHFDWRWLEKCVPTLTMNRDYHLADVSAMRTLLGLWAPDVVASRPPERKLHRVDPDLDDSIAQGRHYRDALRRLDGVQGSVDLIRSLVRPRPRPDDVPQFVDAHGCTWTEDSFGGWSSLTCEESPLATKADIEVAAGPLVAVERG